ncbi:EAL domain-containing protein [Alicycliphilus denitrificans]|uniref:bifunctional diguanylate cyclase/phosphodiesterase n=1 Tax=Alicycliphilus denitrificans TaxID=179636 RepID=UPI00384A4DC6
MLIWLLTTLFVAVLASSAMGLVWSMRTTAVRSAEGLAEHMVSGVEATLNRNLLSLDLLLSGVQNLLQAGATSDAQADGRMLTMISRDNLLVGRLALLDAKGRVRAVSGNLGPLQDFSLPPSFWAEMTASNTQRLHVSAMVQSFATAQPVLFFARSLSLDDGPHWVVAEVPLTKFTPLVQRSDPSGFEILLEKTNGQRLFALPDLPESGGLGLQGRDIPFPERAWNVPARISGVPALVLGRSLLYPELRVSVSLPVAVALARWNAERNAVLVVALVLCAVLLLVAAVAVKVFRNLSAARQTVAASKAMLDQALEAMEGGFVLLDRENRLVHWNRRYEDIFPGMRACLAPQVPFREVLVHGAAIILPAGSDAERQQWVAQRLSWYDAPTQVHELVMPDGRHIHAMARPTSEGGRVITYHDVTDLHRAKEEIENLAFYDALTGLPNRRLLLERLGQAIVQAQRSGSVGALLFLDLDHFKVINDTKGHEMGDELLKQVAQRLLAHVRVADTVARLGGDEFVVMLSDLPANSQEAAAQAQRIAEKVLHSLGEPFLLGDYAYQGAASIGATLFGASVQSATELLRRADIAMYQAKAQRGNALCFFDPEMQTAINERAQLEADLRQALHGDQLVLHYQPQCRVNGEVVGAECLVRWQHPQRGLVPPGQFIPVAEDSELILDIGQWVLQTACRQLATWQQQPGCAGLKLSVNVSARQFRQTGFVHQVVEVLQATGAPAHLLTLELTESMVLDNVQDAIEKMHQLRIKGVQFALDDFGTGYSSLAYLTSLPLHMLKIDQSFVRHLGERPADDAIVQTIIGMGRNLNLEITAEGVETQEQKDTLAGYGCDLYQGYLLGRPAPLELLQERLQEPLASAA